jgi:molybdopterin converting factor small subunit
MKVAVKMFAGLRELAGGDEVVCEIASGATVAQLRRELIAQLPQAKALLTHSLFAVAGDYATEETPLEADVEVACIPPVSGG